MAESKTPMSNQSSTSSTPRQAAAARENGKRGGRPRRLPLLFRTLRGNKISEEALDKMIELVKSSDSNGDDKS